jgi:hypothetical protein
MPKLLYKIIQCCTDCPYLFFDPDADVGYCDHQTVLDRQLDAKEKFEECGIAMAGFEEAMQEEEINNSTPTWCPLPEVAAFKTIDNINGNLVVRRIEARDGDTNAGTD